MQAMQAGDEGVTYVIRRQSDGDLGADIPAGAAADFQGFNPGAEDGDFVDRLGALVVLRLDACGEVVGAVRGRGEHDVVGA